MSQHSVFTWILVLMVLCTGLRVAQAQPASSNMLFILDGSGSMWGQVEGQHKIVIAKDIMTRLVQELPDNIRAGLQVYGHRSKGDCDDIQMLVPVGADNRQTLIEQIESIKPKGKTPITKAFQHAAEQLRALEDQTTIVLVSDGKETCAGDPCTLVRDLREQGIKIRVHVVGFDVDQDEREQLVCIAEAGGGKYFSADNADQLQQALTEVREEVVAMVDESRCQQYAETAAAQQQSNLDNACGLQGELWESDVSTHFERCRALPEAAADQLDQANNARQQALDHCQQERQAQREQCQQYAAIAVQHEQQNLANECGFEGERWQADTGHHLNWCLSNADDPNVLAAEHSARENALAQCLAQAAPKASEATGIQLQAILTEDDTPLEKNLSYTVYEAEKDLQGRRKSIANSYSPAPLFRLSPGQYHVTVEHGSATAEAELEVKAGQLTEYTFVLNAGYLRLSSVPVEGAEPLDNNLNYRVYEAKKDLQGKRKSVADSYNHEPLFRLPAGQYYVTAKHGNALASAELEVNAGELTEHTMVLNVGYLRLSSVPVEDAEPLDNNLNYRVYEAKKDLQGKRKSVADSYNHEPLFRLPAGQYYVTAKHGNALASAELEVNAGELTEHTMVLNVGYLRLSSVPVEGAEPLDNNLNYRVHEAKKDLQGKRKSVADSYNHEPLFRLPPGQYHVTVKHGDQRTSADVVVKVGELTEYTLVLGQ